MGHINTDIPELKGYDTGIVLGNLERLCRRSDDETEALAAHLYELAEAIRRDASGDFETVETILRALSADLPSESPAREAASALSETERLSGHAGLRQRLTLYRAIVSMLTEELPPCRKGKRTPSPLSKGRIAYFPNAFADRAYRLFSGHLSAERGGAPCRTVACRGFAEACEEVTRGKCEFCILPLESSADGKLVGFSRLIAEQGLFITAVCDVENRALAESNVTRFGLLSQRPETEVAAWMTAPRRTYLELLCTPSSLSITELMIAADFCGMTLRRMDTIPLMDGACPLCGVWDASGADDVGYRAFLGYVSLEASDDVVLGQYDPLKIM